MRGLQLALLCCLVVAGRRSSFVDGAPVAAAESTGTDDSQQQQQQQHQAGSDVITYDQAKLDEVKQLEELKNSFGKTFSVLTSQSATSVTGPDGDTHARTQEEHQAAEDGHVLARLTQTSEVEAPATAPPASRSRVELSLPQLGVHVVGPGVGRGQPGQPEAAGAAAGAAQKERRSGEPTAVAGLSPYSGVQYSPRDMAEYVFWTGDEKGVALAIEEFLQEGLMSREEAIRFLQDIKISLQQLQQQLKPPAKQLLSLLEPPATVEPNLDNELPRPDKKESQDDNRVVDEDYEELLERLKVVDSLYTEYSLEEVIYQLAKLMFAQSLSRGSSEAQAALHKFTTFLESEAEQGHISRGLEKKVLDVLISSLADTLSERPQLLAAARQALGAGSSSRDQLLLGQLLSLAPTPAARRQGNGDVDKRAA